MTSQPIAPARMGKYVFALLVLQALFGVVLIAIESTGVTLPSAVNIVGGIVGAMGAASWFFNDHQRDMNTIEKRRLALWGTIFTLLLGVVVMAMMAVAIVGLDDTLITVRGLITESSPGKAAILAIVILLSALLSYAVYYFAAGLHARARAKGAGPAHNREPPRL